MPPERLVIAHCGERPIAFAAASVRRLQAGPDAADVADARDATDAAIPTLPIERLFNHPALTHRGKRRGLVLEHRGQPLLILVDEPVSQRLLPSADLHAPPVLLRERPGTDIIRAIARIDAASGPLLIPVLDLARAALDDLLAPG